MLPRLHLPDGQHLAYLDDGEGPDVLVLLHGGGLDHRMWQSQLGAFPGWRVIAPDARGHGDSSTPSSPYRLVDDVVAILDALELVRVVVVGLSMGAGTAVDLAVERPDRVRGLVVSGTGTSAPDFRDPWVLDIFATWQRAVEEQDPEAWIEGFARFVPGPHRGPGEVDPDVLAANDAMVRHTLATHILPRITEGRAPVQPSPVVDVNQRRRHVEAPVLAITGGGDADGSGSGSEEINT
ncbi:MAG: alpha/beta hydrolase, partial [Pseudonocardia sp.]|nr:alpha/beta hydrolase [Pseudonocardia sp.]